MSARYVRPPLPFDKAALVSDEVDVVAVYTKAFLPPTPIMTGPAKLKLFKPNRSTGSAKPGPFFFWIG